MKKIKNVVSNIEELENSTILKTLENVIDYVKDNAKAGPQGEKGEKGDTGATGPTGPQGVQGATGVGIAAIENKGYTDGDGFTTTHVEVLLTNGNTETFDVQALQGKQGPTGATGATGPQGVQGVQGVQGATGVGISSVTTGTPVVGETTTTTPLTLTLTNNSSTSVNIVAQNGSKGETGPQGPAGKDGGAIEIVTLTGTSGTISDSDLATLQANVLNMISLGDELYRLNDNMTNSGYLVYSHVGQDSTNNYYIKCVTITISTLAWVTTSQKNLQVKTKIFYLDDSSQYTPALNFLANNKANVLKLTASSFSFISATQLTWSPTGTQNKSIASLSAAGDYYLTEANSTTGISLATVSGETVKLLNIKEELTASYLMFTPSITPSVTITNASMLDAISTMKLTIYYLE